MHAQIAALPYGGYKLILNPIGADMDIVYILTVLGYGYGKRTRGIRKRAYADIRQQLPVEGHILRTVAVDAVGKILKGRGIGQIVGKAEAAHGVLLPLPCAVQPEIQYQGGKIGKRGEPHLCIP